MWIKDEVDIPDKQAFMDLLVRTTVEILNNEPIDIYVNPTYLPEVIAKEVLPVLHSWQTPAAPVVVERAAAE